MPSKALVPSNALHGEEECRRVKVDEKKSVMTLKNMMALQTISLFTISYELQTTGKRPWQRNT